MFAFVAAVFGGIVIAAIFPVIVSALAGAFLGNRLYPKRDKGDPVTMTQYVLTLIGFVVGLLGGYFFFLLLPCLNSGACTF